MAPPRENGDASAGLETQRQPTEGVGPIDFATEPSAYRHWKLTQDGRVATLALDVQENETLFPGYELKLNSYDLGVDIELHDAMLRLRFEHPEVGAVVITSSKPRLIPS